MAAEKGLFLNTILKAFVGLEDQLIDEQMEKNNVKEAFKELAHVLEPVARRYFGDVRYHHKYVVGQYFPMLQRMAVQWYSQLRRLPT